MYLQTRDHNWAIYVNPVGVDATVKTLATRCVAGGYVWNPFFTQLADPLNVRFFFNLFVIFPLIPPYFEGGTVSSRMWT